MKQVLEYKFYRARNAEHFQFHTDVLNVITASVAESHHLEGLRNAYAALFAEENAAYLLTRGYESTRTVEEQDAVRDDLFLYIRQSIDANLFCPVPEKKSAASKLNFILKLYRSANQLPYAENTAQVSNFVADLQSATYAPHVATLGLTEALALLKTANDEFNARYSGRSGEKLDRASTEKMKTIRPQVDAAYQTLITAVNALYQVNELTTRTPTVSTTLGGVIDGVTALLLQLQETLSRRGAGSGSFQPGAGGQTPNPTLPGGGGDDDNLGGETPGGGGGETPDPNPLD